MHGVDLDVTVLVLVDQRLQLPREHDLRQFALVVRQRRIVVFPAAKVSIERRVDAELAPEYSLSVDVVEVDAAVEVRTRRDVYDARVQVLRPGGPQQRHQQVRKQEVAQIIHSELALVAVLGDVVRRRHYSRVVDQEVHFGVALPDHRGEVAHRLGISGVEVLVRNRCRHILVHIEQTLHVPLRFLRIAHS